MASSASACGRVRGKPSSSTPSLASGSARRDSMTRTTSSSGTRSPAAMIGATSLPSGVPLLASLRSISPVETWGRAKRSVMKWAWVPLPPPGGPNRMVIIALLDEALVLPHEQLGLDLFHGVQGDADDDQHRRAAQVEAGGGHAGEEAGQQRQGHRDDGQEHRSGE